MVFEQHIPFFDLHYDNEKTTVGDIEQGKRFFSDNDNSLKVFQVNICNISKNFNELLVLLKALDSEIDCIVLTETGTNTYPKLDLFGIDGYNMHYPKSHYRQNDGVVVYVKSELAGPSEEVVITDSNCLTFSITKNKKVFSCTAIYRSPNGRYENFITALRGVLDRISKPNTIRLLLGDININILNEEDNKASEYLNLLSEKGFHSYCDKPTGNNNNCLDHVFVSPYLGDQGGSFIVKSRITDHYPILTTFCLSKKTKLNLQTKSLSRLRTSKKKKKKK